MPCYAPLQGWRSRERNPSGKRGVTFDFKEGYADQPVDVPCGQCIGCRISRSRQWALRILHEAKTHEDNCFLTLTYADDKCPRSLQLSHLQLFIRELRRRTGQKVRYFGVGEYGEAFSRPHYHVCLFGYDFPDKKYWCGSGLSKQSRSALLEDIWVHGFSTVGSLTSASAQYAAKYVTKIDRRKDYGGRRPEFAVMSRNPGLGSAWIDQFSSSVFPRDFVVVDGGRRVAVPRFYLEKMPDPVKARIKYLRKKRNEDNPDNRGMRALAIAECKLLNIMRERRGYENEVRGV